MAQADLTDGCWKMSIQDAGGNPMGFREIGEGGTTHFTVLALEVNGVTYYYWPDSSGVLRYGTTEPTILTQDDAGAAV